jgi:hypothetical protein
LREVSLLLGAGFSRPGGYCTAEELNCLLKEKILGLDESLIELKARPPRNPILRLAADPDRFHREDVPFITELGKWYVSHHNTFDYEEFFDFYYGVLNENQSSPEFNSFGSTGEDLLLRCHHWFLSRVTDLLSRPYRNPTGEYGPFNEFVKAVGLHFDRIHVHTLNHDLLFENLSQRYGWDIADGYTITSASYYYTLPDQTRKRTPFFSAIFDRRLSLYKLHRSIDHWIYQDDATYPQSIKVCPFPEPDTLGKEGSPLVPYRNVFPDFLVGRKTKKSVYDTRYYRDVFDLFDRNLRASRTLIVIGYGQQDEGINNKVRENFTCSAEKKLIVLDPKIGDSNRGEYPLLQMPCAIHYGPSLGVDDIDFAEVSRLAGW